MSPLRGIGARLEVCNCGLQRLLEIQLRRYRRDDVQQRQLCVQLLRQESGAIDGRLTLG
jgi:hypothetical protein